MTKADIPFVPGDVGMGSKQYTCGVIGARYGSSGPEEADRKEGTVFLGMCKLYQGGRRRTGENDLGLEASI